MRKVKISDRQMRQSLVRFMIYYADDPGEDPLDAYKRWVKMSGIRILTPIKAMRSLEYIALALPVEKEILLQAAIYDGYVSEDALDTYLKNHPEIKN